MIKTELVHFTDEQTLQKKLAAFSLYKIVAILPYHQSSDGKCCGQPTTTAVIVVYEKA